MAHKIYFKIFTVILFVTFFSRGYAGTVNGQIQIASSGRGLVNGILTFTLSQSAVISGAATVVTSPVNCYTDTTGNIVGLPNPQSAPVLSSNSGSGTLPIGSYYVRYTWANSTGETVSSAETVRATTLTGTLIVQAPVNPPMNATQWKVYISATSGTETLQAIQTVPFTNYSQSVPLIAGAVMPAANTSLCNLRFNDELQPSYTGYNVNLTAASGAIIPGFPQKWYLSGGAAGIVNVGAGLPLYNGVVVYPQPVLSIPTNNAQQSISGPLSLGSFNLSAGAIAVHGPITGADLTIASNGNSVTLLNIQNNLAPVVGTGADTNVFTYTVPANIVAISKAIRLRFWFSHSAGTAAVNYKFKIGSTTISNYGSPNGIGTFSGGIFLYNQGGGLCAKIDEPLLTSTPSIQAAPAYFAGSVCDFSAGFTVNLTFNVLNTDQVTPEFWVVELVQ